MVDDQRKPIIPMPQIIVELARDRDLNGRDLQVWVISTSHLDFVDFRPLPIRQIVQEYNDRRPMALVSVADGIRPPDAVSRSAVSRALVRLVGRGYLERAEHRGAYHVALYRLPLARVYPRRAS
jgi:hypothetical protein